MQKITRWTEQRSQSLDMNDVGRGEGCQNYTLRRVFVVCKRAWLFFTAICQITPNCTFFMQSELIDAVVITSQLTYRHSSNILSFQNLSIILRISSLDTWSLYSSVLRSGFKFLQGYDMLEDMYSPKSAATQVPAAWLRTRPKGNTEFFMTFIVQIMNEYQVEIHF